MIHMGYDLVYNETKGLLQIVHLCTKFFHKFLVLIIMVQYVIGKGLTGELPHSNSSIIFRVDGVSVNGIVLLFFGYIREVSESHRFERALLFPSHGNAKFKLELRIW